MTFADLSWSADDVLELRPGWTRAQALVFLAEHETQLRDRLTEHGWFILDLLIGGHS